jgi:hypothetical protein
MTERTGSGIETRFVVGSATEARDDSPGKFDLRHKVNPVKAALLYADKVELVSTGASMLYGFVAPSEGHRVRHGSLLSSLRPSAGFSHTPRVNEAIQPSVRIMPYRPFHGSEEVPSWFEDIRLGLLRLASRQRPPRRGVRPPLPPGGAWPPPRAGRTRPPSRCPQGRGGRGPSGSG